MKLPIPVELTRILTETPELGDAYLVGGCVRDALLGEAIAAALEGLARRHPGHVAITVGYDEGLSHLGYAASDFTLVPSRFEPCGLNQMYSQRYGTPPLVHATGGLLDTVVDCTPATLADGSASGFLFHTMTPGNFLAAIRRVSIAYRDKPVWRRLQKNGMAKDFSWRLSAAAYREIYLSLLSRPSKQTHANPVAARQKRKA